MKNYSQESLQFDFSNRSSISDYLQEMEKIDKKDYKNDIKLTNELVDKLFKKCINYSENQKFECIFFTQNDDNHQNNNQYINE